MPATPVMAAKPVHVPDDLVRDFDFANFDGVFEDPQLAWRRVQESYPEIFWTPRYGGHWVVTRAEPMKEICEDYARFSNRDPFIPRDPNIPPLIPVQLDPPDHATFRKLLMPGFLPRAVAAIEEKARAHARRAIETIATQGECEFVRDFAEQMAITVFLGMMGLPIEDLPHLRENLKYTQEVDRAEGFARFHHYIASWVAERRQNPQDDLISTVVHGQVDGRPLTSEEVQSVCVLLLTGGLDTVVTMLANIARFLAEHPDHRKQLLEAPEISANQIEELVRRLGVTNLARVVVDDVVYAGLQFKKGEQILLTMPAAGLDERLNPDALSVDFQRESPRHLAFGAGVHTCIGASLARREIRIFLEEWLKRIPNFAVKAGTKPLYLAGIVNTMNELWLTWDAA